MKSGRCSEGRGVEWWELKRPVGESCSNTGRDRGERWPGQCGRKGR